MKLASESGSFQSKDESNETYIFMRQKIQQKRRQGALSQPPSHLVETPNQKTLYFGDKQSKTAVE